MSRCHEADTWGRSAAGWLNICITCALAGRPARYWVRASDVTAAHARRFVSPESNELHQCA